jgi:5-epi-alpha-selinene synthase
MNTVVLPRLYCPFPLAINKHAESLHQHTIEWVRKFNLITDEAVYQQFCESKFSDLAARVYPHAEFKELKLLSDWNVWLFIFDDQIDEGGIGKQPEQLTVFYTRLVDVLKDSDTAPQLGPLGAALQDIRQRIIQQKPSTCLMNRFIYSVENCLAASVWEAKNRANGITPNVATYIKMRTLTSGIPTILDLILIALRLDLPPEVLNHSDVQCLSLMANNAVCWANDIFSSHKEMSCGDVHNLVLTLRHEHQCNLQEAIQRAVELHDNEVRAFVELETQLPSFGKDVDYQLERYVSSLCSWMRGSLDWHCTSERYRFAEAGFYR